MKLRSRLVLQLALWLALGAFSFGADSAYLYVVHGIPGRDIAATANPGLPIDILIDGNCMVRGFTFTSTAGPYTLAPGSYNVQVSWANTLAPCTNLTEFATEATLGAGASATIVAALVDGQPELLQFANNLTPVPAGSARFVFVQSAEAPALQATLTQVNVKSPQTFTVTAQPDAQAAIYVPAGEYLVQVTANDSTTVLASEEIGLPDQSASFVYATGEAANGFVALINRTVRDVF